MPPRLVAVARLFQLDLDLWATFSAQRFLSAKGRQTIKLFAYTTWLSESQSMN